MSADGVVPWVLIVIGAGRVAQALALRETWGAEATVCLAMLILGVLELWSCRKRAAPNRS